MEPHMIHRNIEEEKHERKRSKVGQRTGLFLPLVVNPKPVLAHSFQVPADLACLGFGPGSYRFRRTKERTIL